MYNRAGQARWNGVLYGGVGVWPKLLRPVVYHGRQGHAQFQRVSRHRGKEIVGWAGALLPLTVPAIIACVALGLVWPWFFAGAAAILLGTIGFGAVVAASVPVHREPNSRRLRLVVGTLHVLQPFWRTWGRLRGPRRPAVAPIARPWRGDRAEWLADLELRLRQHRCTVISGGPNDPWDLEVRCPWVRVRVATAVTWNWESHAALSVRLRSSVVLLGVAAAMVVPRFDLIGVVLASIAVAAATAESLRCIGIVRREVRIAVPAPENDR